MNNSHGPLEPIARLLAGLLIEESYAKRPTERRGIESQQAGVYRTVSALFGHTPFFYEIATLDVRRYHGMPPSIDAPPRDRKDWVECFVHDWCKAVGDSAKASD